MSPQTFAAMHIMLAAPGLDRLRKTADKAALSRVLSAAVAMGGCRPHYSTFTAALHFLICSRSVMHMPWMETTRASAVTTTIFCQCCCLRCLLCRLSKDSRMDSACKTACGTAEYAPAHLHSLTLSFSSCPAAACGPER